MNVEIRKISQTEYALLKEFLLYAVLIPTGFHPPSKKRLNEPALPVCLDGFGLKPGDCGVVAVQEGRLIGAAWARKTGGSGSGDTPSLAISLLPEFRGTGTGTRLLAALLKALGEEKPDPSPALGEKRSSREPAGAFPGGALNRRAWGALV